MSKLSQKTIESLETQLLTLRQQIVEIHDKFETACSIGESARDDPQKIPVFLSRAAKLTDYLDQYEVIQSDIRGCCVKLDKMTDYGDDVKRANALEELYYQATAIASEFSSTGIDDKKPVHSATLATANNLANLPKIPLPTFSGILSDWPSFYDSFKSLIHRNNTLSDIEKFYYLQSALSGQAVNIVKSIPLIAANYELAWSALIERYDNKRVLANHYLDKIFNFKPNTSRDRLAAYQSFLDILVENVTALKRMNIPDLGDFVLVCLALRTLDSPVRTNFESAHSTKEFPTFNELSGFIKRQCHIFEMSLSENRIDGPTTSRAIRSFQPPTAKRSFMSFGGLCPKCHKEHQLFQCDAFLQLRTTDRVNYVKSLQRCFNCLGTHFLSHCNSRNVCRICNKKHHTLLHLDTSKEVHASQSTDIRPQALNCFQQPHSTVLLGTALVLIEDAFGRFHQIRVVVDTGSQLSFITEDCVKRLNLHKRKYSFPISGVGETAVRNAKGVVTCTLNSRLPLQPTLTTDAVILQHISANLPSIQIPINIINKYQGKVLADPDFGKPGQIDFLLGADLWPQIFAPGNIENMPGYPSACLTIFGWLVIGKVKEFESPGQVSLFSSTDDRLETALKMFWEVEEPLHKHFISSEDREVETQFDQTHYRLPSGRFVVKLPFRTANPQFGDSYTTALNRFKSLERRLVKNPSLYSQYRLVIKDYLDTGHMSIASLPGKYIIPHHSVVNENSSTTRLRVVFDASAKTSGYISLNDSLYVGPKLQCDISEILTNFRVHRYTLCADVKQMYRQIMVYPSDRQFQHILWRDCPSEPVREFELNTVTFGVTPSPFLAIRVLLQLIQDDGHHFPAAARVLKNDVLVDDIITGANTEEDAIDLQTELISLLSRGGFTLRKWMSTSEQVLENIPLEDRSPLNFSEETQQNLLKVLGVQWDNITDSFCFKIVKFPVVFTKRGLLSLIARLYDPLGWLSPFMLLAKFGIRLIWLAKCSWDDMVPSKITEFWQQVLEELPSLSHIRIPRFILHAHTNHCSLIGFSDASERGYAAVVYLHCEDENGCVKISLLKAKTKVAPLKVLTIPRLELCAALLLARIVKSLDHLYSRLTITSTWLFTDSTIVLSWLHTPPHQLKVFVSNRVVEIMEVTNLSSWCYVPTDLNPADCASRGITPKELISHDLWWSGPKFINKSLSNFPPFLVKLKTTNLPEIKDSNSTSCMTATLKNFESIEWTFKFSSLAALQRIVAYMCRFGKNATRHKADRRFMSLLPSELEDALLKLVKMYQQIYFKDTFALLAKDPHAESPLRRLAPFIDSLGILRVGGRLRNSSLPFAMKHPIIIPKGNHLTTLLIEHYHRCYLHAGPRILQSLLQRKFWIINARNSIRGCIRKCLTCFRFTATPIAPYMANLPSARSETIRAFLKICLDFAGPFSLKDHNRRGAKITKGYFCLFVCQSTKAIHLEAVSNLSTPAFLAAFERFISRRGLCIEIVSDCGTNFIGASRHLRSLYAFLNDGNTQNTLNQGLSKYNITWKFNCPAAPHFNGLSEAGVKSTKYFLRRIMNDRSVTFEEFATLLAKVEAVLNSRPLCPLHVNPCEPEDYLTPGHFLVFSPLVAIPQENLEAVPEQRLSRWQLVEQITQHFWKRYQREYLHTLQERSKWNKRSEGLEVGELVLISDIRTAPADWSTAVIESVHPSSDGVPRVITVRTKSGLLVRPAHKLIRFPLDKPQKFNPQKT